ncbi:C40 family peptidase [Exiguobacterium flavidum]|uniref:C40 family peptidase n=1 Tax=Exiguobacterium flavidum TaxID=2184695 RepID=UPI000DF7A6D0|nr:C40 family peptidase [Exiguobacterium flavidum]
MKKTTLALTAAVLIGTATNTSSVSAATTQVTLTDNVNIRASATTSSKKLATLKKGTKLTAYKQLSGWYQIKYAGKTAYVSSAYAKTVAIKQTAATYVTNTENVNVRERPTTVSKVLGKLKLGTKVTIKKTSNNWHEISYSNKTAYVHAPLVSLKQSKPNAAKPATPSLPLKLSVSPVDASKTYSVDSASGLNVRTSPEMGNNIMTTVANKTVLDVTGSLPGWYQIKLSGKTVYVASQLVKTTNAVIAPPVTQAPSTPAVPVIAVDTSKTYRVNSSTGLNVRRTPDTTLAPYTKLADGTVLTVTGETTGASSGWYQIQINGVSYYVAKDYVVTGAIPPVVQPVGATVMERAISVGQAYIGTPYIWASSSPLNGGFDCSGFIAYVVNQGGKPVGRTNVAGYWSNDAHFGPKLSKLTAPKRGDLVFFENTYTSGPSHMGIMVNDQEFIHAVEPLLTITKLSSSYWTGHLLGFKRI